MNYLFDVNRIINENNFASPLLQDLSNHLSSKLQYPFVKCGFDPSVDNNIILMVSLSPASEWDNLDFYKTPHSVFVVEPGTVSQYNKCDTLPSFKKSFFNTNDECSEIIDTYFSGVSGKVGSAITEALVDLPKATIPRDIQINLSRLIDKINTKKINYNQKINILSDVLYSLKLDKLEFNRLLQKIKATYTSSNESILRESGLTKFYAFWNKKKYKVEGSDVWDAKQKAIKILKVPKNKVGLLAVVNAVEHDKGGFKTESVISEKDEKINNNTEGKKFYAIWDNVKYSVTANTLHDAKQKALSALKLRRSDATNLPVVDAEEHDSGDFQFDTVVSTIKHPLVQQFNTYHPVDDIIELARSSKTFKDFAENVYRNPKLKRAYFDRKGFIPFIRLIFKHVTK